MAQGEKVIPYLGAGIRTPDDLDAPFDVVVNGAEFLSDGGDRTDLERSGARYNVVKGAEQFAQRVEDIESREHH